MNHHIKAWEKVEKHIFGSVCEVTIKKPWGFKEDRDDIINLSIDEFEKDDNKYGTIILHILSGEGESEDRIISVLEKAYNNSVKIIILEHNPDSSDFSDLKKIDFIEGFIKNKGELFEYEDFGRNVLYAFTTMLPLCIPELSDKYVEKHINKTYVNKDDHGVCINNLIYTHTSEEKIDITLPDGDYIWVIGGGISLESMREDCNNILIDSVLRQCVYTANLCGVEKWKTEKIYKIKDKKELKKNWLSRWREVKINNRKPDYILHKGLADIKEINKIIYVSTVDDGEWKHLKDKNIILDAWTEPRDIIKIL